MLAKTLFSLILYSSAAFAIPTQGIVLMESKDDLGVEGIEGVHGLGAINVTIPGGIDKLANILEPKYIGKEPTKQTTADLKTDIYNYYVSKSYPVVAVKELESSTGVLKLLVINSSIDDILVMGNKWTTKKEILAATRVKKGDKINERNLTSSLDYLNQNPFRQVNVVYAPGNEKGTTNLEFIVNDRLPFQTYVGVDNTGIPVISRTRVFGGVNVGNLFWAGHELAYQYTASPDFEQFQAHTLNYVVPMFHRHFLNLWGGHSRLDTTLQQLTPISVGRSTQVSGRYEIPLFTWGNLAVRGLFGGDFKRTNNTLEFSNVIRFGSTANLTQLSLAADLAYHTPFQNTDLDLELYWSPGQWIGDQRDKNYQLLRPGAKNHYVYARAMFNSHIFFPHDFQCHVRLKGQISSQNLLPSEELGFGGIASVRGYDERQVNVDTGILGNLELLLPSICLAKYSGREIDDGLRFYGFLDGAVGKFHTKIGAQKNPPSLLSAGPGARYSLSRYINATVEWGLRLHRDGFGDGRSRLHFSVAATY